MLTITIPKTEMFNEETQEFSTLEEVTLKLEHSLVSLSKWESKWCKPFLTKEEKTQEQTLDYIRCMTITPNVDPKTFTRLSRSNIDAINDYIAAPMTATTFNKIQQRAHGNEVITSELIYYWMFSLGIPMECQKWHLNRLITLVQVFNVKNTPPKKMGRNDVARQYASLNASRRKQFNSRG